ncbi:hypothetical protein [Actinocorallia longicatena]|uniref:Uncharacterized protein n=1 Tax=Actinocorallia longicatena TaxID=111803 RepID=A0ABP6Q9V0_9ACTN
MILRIATAGAVTAALLVPAAAHAAGSPWKTVASTKMAGSEQFTDIAVAGKNAAWLFGTRAGTQKGERLAYHWNGRKWARAALPRGLRSISARGVGYGFREPTLSASSARNAWSYIPGDYSYNEDDGSGEICPETGYSRRRAHVPRLRKAAPDALTIKKAARVLRWEGTKWVVARVLKDVVPEAIVARGTKETLVFGQSARTGAQVVLRFDGKRWRTAKLPFYVTAAKLSGGKVFVAGYDAKTFGAAVLRWDGRRWKDLGLAQALPRETVATKDQPGTSSYVTDFSVEGAKVTVSGATYRETLCQQNAPSPVPFLLAGNGTWRHLTLDGLGSMRISGQTGDGRGGLYAVADNFSVMPEDFANWEPRTDLFHRTATGRWKRESLPRGVEYAALPARVPGTRSIWLTGVRDSVDVDAVVLRRG